MKKLSEKQFIIIGAVPVILIMGYIMYSTFIGSSEEKKETQVNENRSAIILPEVEYDTTPKTKISVYEQLEQKEKKAAELEQQKGKGNFYHISGEIKPEEEQKRANQLNDNLPKPKKSRTVSKSKQVTSTETPQPKKAAEPEKKTESTTQNNDQYQYAFGIYRSNKSEEKTANGDSKENYIPALLERQMKIKNGSEVVFLLQKETMINNILFPKMSIMYGMADFSNNRVNITINTIQDNSGEKHPVTLIGYNENYQKGIYYTDKVEKVTENARSRTVSQTAAKALGGGTTSQIVSGSSNGLLSRENGEVNVSEGYLMYFKIDEM